MFLQRLFLLIGEMYHYHLIILDHYTLLSCQNFLFITKLETCKLCEGIIPAQCVAGKDVVSWPEGRST